MGRTLGSALAALLAGPMLAAPAAPAQPSAPDLAMEPVPYEMDSSNQAGWWHPLAEFEGSTYFVFNAPAAEENRHQVHVARRSPSGAWTAGCLQDASGACVDYGDDLGHNQPSLALDGDGYLHAFVSMHNDQWRYYRSAQPESVTTIVDRSADLPDQDGGVTYPVTATAPRSGDVYLMARVNVPGIGHTGRLYRWRVDDATWQREAVFTPGHLDSGYVPYPDDLEVDNRGHVHLLWQWARGSTSNLRYYGSYLVYQPLAGRFVTAGGTPVELPVTPEDAEVVYEPREGAVQSARLALVHHTPLLAGIAYRYRPPGESRFEVRWAGWDGGQWVRETVDAGGFNTFAAIATTHHRSTARVYYVRHPACDPEQAAQGTVHVAEKHVTAGSAGDGGQWRTRRLGGGSGTERLAAAVRRDGTDVLYLAAPHLENPAEEPVLRYATLPRAGATTPATEAVSPLSAPDGRRNWAFGAPVEVSSTLDAATSGGECAVDGNSWADYSRWMSAGDDPEPAIDITFDEPIQVDQVHLYSGYQGGTTDVVEDFALDLEVDGDWREVAQVTGNDASPAVVTVDDLAFADRLRLRVLGVEHPNHLARVYEVEVYSRADAPPLELSLSADPPSLVFAGQATQVEVALANRSLAPVSGPLEVTAPPGWTVEPTGASYALAPNESTSVAFTVTSPPDAAAAEFEVAVRAPAHEATAVVTVPVRGGILYSDDGAPSYAEAGPWSASTLPGHAGTGSRYAQGGTGATATWTPDLPHAGTYQVQVWSPTNPTTTNAAQYTVAHAGGTAGREVDQLADGGAWYLLGEWEFAAGTAGSVTLMSVAPGYHRANAVRFTPVTG